MSTNDISTEREAEQTRSDQKPIRDALDRTGAEEKVAGKGDSLVGKIQQTVGNITGNNNWKREGTARQGSGTLKEFIGGAKEKFEHAARADPPVD